MKVPNININDSISNSSGINVKQKLNFRYDD